MWQHYGYYQHLSLSYKRWHWWCHDIIIGCLEAYDVKSDVDLWVKVCFFANLCIFVPLFLFCSFCSAIFAPLFLFRWGLFALKPHLPHYLIDNFCSADLFALALTNFCSTFCSAIFVLLGPFFVPLFLFRYFCSTDLFALALTNFCSTIFVPLFLFCWGLFALKPIFVPLFLFHYFCSTIFVPWGPFFVLLFLFHWVFFCSAIFVLLFLFRYFCPLFLFCWPFYTCTYQILFCYFCSAGAFLHLNPILPHYLIDNFCSADSTHQFLFRWPVFVPPTNFCSAIFVPPTNFCSADLFFVPPTNFVLPFLFRPPIFVPLFLFRSPIFVLLTFLHLHLGSPSPNGRQYPPIFVPLTFFLFRPPIFVLLFLFCSPIFCSTDLFPLALGVPITQWPTVPTNFCSADLFFVPPTNFCSAVFVPLTNFCSADLFALALGVPINGRQCPPIFVLLTFLHLHCPHQFLFHRFCSAHLFALTTVWEVHIT